ncbi:MAG: SDR family oxidoreductase [Elusimicrobia bacterium]|nr:SDR family oxidoreductase [Elusimicrobiota bacterium]
MSGRARGVVAITGASAGVGRALSRLMAAEGFDVGLIARGRDGLEGARAEVLAAGRKACLCVADVAVASQVEAAAERIEGELGPIDIWVNNAMVSIFSPVADITPEEVRRVTEVTYLGAVYGTLAALKRMRSRDRGVIVQVGSALAYRSIPLQSAYCAAKHAMKGFTDSLRSELIHERSGVRVTMVQLPGLNTPQFGWVRSKLRRHPRPVPPIYEPEVAAQAIYWASQNPRRELNVGWQTVKAIVGEHFIPGMLDRLLAGPCGYDSQLGPEQQQPRPDNLYAPLPGDAGAHGVFHRIARRRTWQFLLTAHRRAIGAAGMMALALAVAQRKPRRRKTSST